VYDYSAMMYTLKIHRVFAGLYDVYMATEQVHGIYWHLLGCFLMDAMKKQSKPTTRQLRSRYPD